MTRKLLLVFLMVLFSRYISGQDLHYLYLRSADQAPFYVKTGLKTYESSGSGYLLIEGLVASSYNLVIGYKSNPLPEWAFSVAVDDKDLAFTLAKKGNIPYLSAMGNSSGASGQLAGSKVVPAAIKDAVKKEMPEGPVSDDAFSRLLADVVDDPTIRLKPVILTREAPVAMQPAPGNTAEMPPNAAVELPASVKESLAAAQKTTETAPSTIPATAQENKNKDLAAATKADTALIVFKPDTAAVTKGQSAGKAHGNTLPEKKEPEAPVAVRPKPPTTNTDTTTVVAAKPTTVPDADPAPAEEQTTARVETTAAANSKKPSATEEKEPVSSVSNVVVKDVTDEAKEAEIKEEARPFVLNEVVKNIKKGRKKNEPQADAPSRFPVSVSIKKTLEKQGADGMELIYVDEVSPGNRETIRILIPAN